MPGVDPSTLPLRDIHLPEAIGWWPPAPGWWLLLLLPLLGFAAAWYSRLRYRRRKYAAVNVAKQELAGIRSRYAADGDAAQCARAVSALVRRVSVSIFPRAESAGLTGKDWLAFLERARVGGKTRLPDNPNPNTGDTEQAERGALPDHIGRLLLEAPYRRRVAAAEVEPLLVFCSDWLADAAGIARR